MNRIAAFKLASEILNALNKEAVKSCGEQLWDLKDPENSLIGGMYEHALSTITNIIEKEMKK